MCTGAGSTSPNYESSKLRNGNFFIKSLLLLLAAIIMIAANWKKKALAIGKSYQRNVLTLTQTMGVLVFLYINGVISDYLFLPSENNSIFILEMLRVIFLENIAFKFLFPIFLIYRTQSSLPSLWQKREIEIKKYFLMTKFNFAPENLTLNSSKQSSNSTQLSNSRRSSNSKQSSNSRHSRFTGISLKTIPEVLPEVDI